LQLPSDGPVEPSIRNLNIFVVLAPHTLPSGAVKAGIKLNEKRICSERPDHLTHYSWDNFLHEVIKLLKQAKARYPAIRERLVPQEHRYKGSPAATDTLNDFTNNLRELAAAANAMQNNDAGAGGEMQGQKGTGLPTISETSASERPNTDTTQPIRQESDTAPQAQLASLDLTDPDATLLPRYVIKTIGLNGWEVIDNAEQWNDLLARRGHEVWADGVINMIVELVEIPVPMESATGGKLVSVGGKRDQGKGKQQEAVGQDEVLWGARVV